MEKLRGGGEMTVFSELTHFTLLLLEFESSSYLVSRKKRKKKKPFKNIFSTQACKWVLYLLTQARPNAVQALKTAGYLERSQGSLCITFMASVIFTGSPGGTHRDSEGRGHFILAELTLQAMLGAPYLTPSCSELPGACP